MLCYLVFDKSRFRFHSLLLVWFIVLHLKLIEFSLIPLPARMEVRLRALIEEAVARPVAAISTPMGRWIQKLYESSS